MSRPAGPNRRVIIWASKPDAVDGVYVEVQERVGKMWFQVGDDWRPTLENARQWAVDQGVDVVVEK